MYALDTHMVDLLSIDFFISTNFPVPPTAAASLLQLHSFPFFVAVVSAAAMATILAPATLHPPTTVLVSELL